MCGEEQNDGNTEHEDEPQRPAEPQERIPGRTPGCLAPDRRKPPRLSKAECQARKGHKRQLLKEAAMRVTGELGPLDEPLPRLPARRTAQVMNAGEDDEGDSDGMDPNDPLLAPFKPPVLRTLPRRKVPPFTEELQEQLLELISNGEEVQVACARLGLRHDTGVLYAKENAEFGERYAEALQLNSMYYLNIAKERAVNGWLEPAFGKDGQVGWIRRFDNKLLSKFLDAKNEQFRNNGTLNVNHNHVQGVLLVPMIQGTREERQRAMLERQRKLQQTALSTERELGLGPVNAKVVDAKVVDVTPDKPRKR